MRERARGCLLGMAVGDALGTTYEFERIDQPPYPSLATGPATDVVGGGPFHLQAGQVTDDTQMACALATSLAATRELDLADVGRRYVTWSTEAFDVGNQTGGALRRIAGESSPASGLEWRAMEPVAAGLATWRDSGHRAAGNGSLMRTAPIAVAFAARGQRAVIEAAMSESAITHADPRCMLACAVFDAMIAAAITRGLDGAAMLGVAREALDQAAATLTAWWTDRGGPFAFATMTRDEVRYADEARAAIAEDLAAATSRDPRVYGAALDVHRTAGFVRVAVRLACWHLVHTPSWRAAVVDVASRGGDADTNAAIVGALLGARDGEAAIPAAWIERVMTATQRGQIAWAKAHHPRRLLALVE